MMLLNYFSLCFIITFSLGSCGLGKYSYDCSCNYNLVDVPERMNAINLGPSNVYWNEPQYQYPKWLCNNETLLRCKQECEKNDDLNLNEVSLQYMGTTQKSYGQQFCNKIGYDIDDKYVAVYAKLKCDNNTYLKTETERRSLQSMSCIDGKFISSPIPLQKLKGVPDPKTKALRCSCSYGLMESPGLELIDLKIYPGTSSSEYKNSTCDTRTLSDCITFCEKQHQSELFVINLRSIDDYPMMMTMCNNNNVEVMYGQKFCDLLGVDVKQKYIGMRAKLVCEGNTNLFRFTNGTSLQKMSCVNRKFVSA